MQKNTANPKPGAQGEDAKRGVSGALLEDFRRRPKEGAEKTGDGKGRGCHYRRGGSPPLPGPGRGATVEGPPPPSALSAPATPRPEAQRTQDARAPTRQGGAGDGGGRGPVRARARGRWIPGNCFRVGDDRVATSPWVVRGNGREATLGRKQPSASLPHAEWTIALALHQSRHEKLDVTPLVQFPETESTGCQGSADPQDGSGGTNRPGPREGRGRYRWTRRGPHGGWETRGWGYRRHRTERGGVEREGGGGISEPVRPPPSGGGGWVRTKGHRAPSPSPGRWGRNKLCGSLCRSEEREGAPNANPHRMVESSGSGVNGKEPAATRQKFLWEGRPTPDGAHGM